MRNVVIVDYVRTPFTKAVDPSSGKKPGALAHLDPVDMFAALIGALLKRTGIDPHDIENVLLGAAHQEAEQGLNPARMAVLHEESGLPLTVQGDSVDKFCGSSLRSIAIAKNDILAGEANVIIAGGVQSMSRIPMGGWNPLQNPHVSSFPSMGITAENLASLYNISRAAQDDFAVDSHRKAATAQESGHFDNEIVPVGGVGRDDGIRPDSTTIDLAKLKPAFRLSGSVTAANSSQVTDGAAAVLLASEDYARMYGLPIKARILSYAGSGCDPNIMGIGPVEASKKALASAGLTMKQIDVVELNEAFAAQSLAVLRQLAKDGMKIAPDILNLDGGAIALGHPLGASGARLVGHAAEVLQREQKRYALVTMCVGGGQGVAMVLENPNPPKP